jgi:hypothetical protein
VDEAIEFIQCLAPVLKNLIDYVFRVTISSDKNLLFVALITDDVCPEVYNH